MADFSNSKSGPGRLFPDNSTESSWNGVEPLVSPVQVKSRHLFGIPLVSAMKDPLTGKAQVYTDDLIKDTIERAVALVESDTGLNIFPVHLKEKKPFSREDYQSFGYMRLEHRPCASIEKLSITPPNGNELYSVPLEWIETAYLPQGQVNLIPLGNSIAYGTPAQIGSGGALFLNVLGSQSWVPAFWQVEYTAGFPDGMIPRAINELIGITAAMEILSGLAATYGKSSSHSLGIDGLSQSVSTPGPQIFKVRYEELQEKQARLIKKLKSQYALTLFSGDV
jgi:hypothetical protein